MNIYATAIYTTRLRRRHFGLFGPKDELIQLMGIVMMSEGCSTWSGFDLDCPTRDLAPRKDEEFLEVVPPIESTKWMSHSSLTEGLYYFLLNESKQGFGSIDNAPKSPITIVTDSDPIEIALIASIVREAQRDRWAGDLEIEYHTLGQALDNAIKWLPTSVYGPASRFSVYIQPEGREYNMGERLLMFCSHDDWMADLDKNPTSHCYRIKRRHRHINRIVEQELQMIAAAGTEAEETTE